MVKGIEATGLPVVHVCTVTPISMTVGANRIVPAIAIPYPLGDPALTAAEEKKLRRQIVEKALHALTVEVDEQTIFQIEIWGDCDRDCNRPKSYFLDYNATRHLP